MMNQQSMYPPLPTDQIGSDEQISPSEEPPPGSPRFWHPIWRAWLWLTCPRPARFGTGHAAQEKLRRAELMSVLFVLMIVVILLIVPSAFMLPRLWLVVVILGGLGLLAMLFNRIGQVTLSGLALVVSTDAGVTYNIVSQPLGLTNSTVSNLYLFAIAILIAGMVLPNASILVVGAAQIALSVIIFYGLPPDTLLIQEIQKVEGNMAYTELLGPIVLHVCCTAIVWLYIRSVDQAIFKASKAEELAEARARLNEQARTIADQKQRLEGGIQAIQDTLARIIRGDHSARVSLQDAELLPLAVTFNMMADRISHVRELEEEQRQMDNALQQLLDASKAISRGLAPAPWQETGSALDRVFPSVQRLHELVTLVNEASGFAADLRTVLVRQQDSFEQMEEQLTSGLALARTIKEKSAAPLTPPVVDGNSGPLTLETFKNRVAELQQVLINLGILLTQQITLLEQTSKNGAQAREYGARCVHGIRLLGQRVKETG